jgi:hypothetical protein
VLSQASVKERFGVKAWLIWQQYRSTRVRLERSEL